MTAAGRPGRGYPARHDRHPARGASAEAGAGAGVGGGHRGRAGRVAHAAADLDAGSRSREHVRPRRRPRHRGRRPGPARTAVVEGVEATAEDRGLPRQGRPHRRRHALASRSLRRRGPHRTRSRREADHAPRVLDVDGEGPDSAARAVGRRGAPRRDGGGRVRAVRRRPARRAPDDQRSRRRARRHRRDRGDVESVGRDHAVGNDEPGPAAQAAPDDQGDAAAVHAAGADRPRAPRRAAPARRAATGSSCTRPATPSTTCASGIRSPARCSPATTCSRRSRRTCPACARPTR